MPSRDDGGSGWPGWARGLASAALGFHLVAIGAAAFSFPPSSELEQGLAGRFRSYYELIDQGYSYRYYAPEPPPTPVVEARLRFADGRPERTIRLPDRSARPRMLYQRQLALANYLYTEFLEQQAPPPPGAPPGARPPLHWAPSYARHLSKVYGCSEVALYVAMHLIPPLDQVRRELAEGAASVDLDAERFYETPQLLGVFPCDAS